MSSQKQQILIGSAAVIVLVALGCVAAYSGRTREAKQSQSTNVQVETPPAEPISSNTLETSESMEILPGRRDCLLTKDNLRFKIVTADEGIRPVEDIGSRKLIGDEIPLFTELFVLRVVPSVDAPRWYLCSKSPRSQHEMGWLQAESVAEWPTRMGLRVIQPVLFYAQESEAIEMAARGSTAARALGRAAPDVTREFLPWPIVRSRTVTNQRGQLVEVALLNFIGERKDNEPTGMGDHDQYTNLRRAQIHRSVNTINLAFCVDNTLSTDPFVLEIIRFINETSQSCDQKAALKLSMTLYRDSVDQLSWDGDVTRTLSDGELQSIEHFVRAAQKIKAPSVSSEDYPECGYQGLQDSIKRTHWEELAHKVIVWIGDNSAHPKGHEKNPFLSSSDIVGLAKQRGITIHAVAIKGGGGDDEQRLHATQCREIASSTGGQMFGLKDAKKVANEIAKAVQVERAIVRKNSDDLVKIERGELSVDEYASTKNQADRKRRYQFVRLLDSAGIDLRRFAPNEPVVLQAWVPTQLPGSSPLFERLVYVSRVELDVLLSELNGLVALLGQDGTKGVLQVFASGLGSRLGDQSFFAQKHNGDIPFDAFMAARGIPLRTGITMKTRDEILSASREEKLLLRARLTNEIIPRLTNARSSNAFTLTGDFDFGWIPENLLP